VKLFLDLPEDAMITPISLGFQTANRNLNLSLRNHLRTIWYSESSISLASFAGTGIVAWVVSGCRAGNRWTDPLHFASFKVIQVSNKFKTSKNIPVD
jgi:hypothetical protein